MRPSMFMGGSGIPAATYVGSTSQQLPTGPLGDLSQANLNLGAIAGLQIGDYIFAFVQGQGAFTHGNLSPAWTQDNFTWTSGGWRNSVHHTCLASLTPPRLIAPVGSSVIIAAYRGASRAFRRSVTQDTDGNSTHVVPGVTRETDCVGLVSNIFDADTATSGFAVSSGWTKRIEASSSFRGAVADVLPRNSYADGAALTWSALGTPSTQVAQMYELRV